MLAALTESLRTALQAEGIPTLSPKARASGKQRTQGIPAGGRGVRSGATPRKRSKLEAAPTLSAFLDEGLAYLRQER